MSKRITMKKTQARKRVSDFRSGEDGSFVILSLFLFLAIILVGGIAVDILRHDIRIKQEVCFYPGLKSLTIDDELLDGNFTIASSVEEFTMPNDFESSEVLKTKLVEDALNQKGIESHILEKPDSAIPSIGVKDVKVSIAMMCRVVLCCEYSDSLGVMNYLINN